MIHRSTIVKGSVLLCIGMVVAAVAIRVLNSEGPPSRDTFALMAPAFVAMAAKRAEGRSSAVVVAFLALALAGGALWAALQGPPKPSAPRHSTTSALVSALKDAA